VHRGQRADGQFEKTVAIKVLDAQRLAADQRHRLSEEVRILARLEHPGLARLIDSGESEDGDPYLVMEYVQGVPLTDHISERNLTAGERVALIIQVARALQYAHQRQVIHCDVKPSNILVTAQGQVRLVDFGIAALDQADAGTEARLYCSPAYAAPERLLGAAPTTSQDIFALGAVLYRALSGRNIRPHDSLTGSSVTEQPTPPSVASTQSTDGTRVDAIEARQLKGDLDAICMKAIAIDPEQRYASLSELIADLEAWREHRPVAARQGGRSYVLSRWLRRHSAIAALGILLVVAMMIGTVISLDQARQAREQAERAVVSRDFLISILEAADPTLENGHDPTASELLRRGAERIQDQLASQPGLLVELLYIIGKTQLARGLADDAGESLDLALEKIGDDQKHPELANVLATRGFVAYDNGEYEESIEWLERAAQAAERNRIDKTDLHGILIQLADLKAVNLDTDAAILITERVLAEQPGVENEVPAMRIRGMAMEIAGDLEGARQVLTEALERQRAIDPAHINAAEIETDLGNVYWRLQDLERSLAMHRASWEHKVQIYGENHTQTLTSLGNVAAISDALGLHDAARRAWNESLERLTVVHGGRDHPNVIYTLGMLALSAYLTDDLADSRRQLNEAMERQARLTDVPPSIRWLDRLAALLDFEEGRAFDPERLEGNREDCSQMSLRSPLGKRLCAAWWQLDARDSGICPPLDVMESISQAVDDWPPRWAHRWQVTRSSCSAAVTPSG
ncbi:MAG: serine/threonine-protein kinase, partial [Wenzhouxiangella sp.]|nr:serine/threonine-protein kinase [Wenzhouxiangella sp.]